MRPELVKKLIEYAQAEEQKVLAQARRARNLAGVTKVPLDAHRLNAEAEQLEQRAGRLAQQAKQLGESVAK